MSPAEKIWWAKIGASIALALLVSALQVFLGVSGMTLFTMGIVVYLALSDVLSKMMSVDRVRGLKIGVGSYFFTWLTAWILLYTCFRPAA